VLSIAVTSGPFSVAVFAGDAALHEADKAAVRSIYTMRRAAQARRRDRAVGQKAALLNMAGGFTNPPVIGDRGIT
jgi:hypothetical protein